MAQAKKDGSAKKKQGESAGSAKKAASEEHSAESEAVDASEAESSTETSGKVAAAAHAGAHGHADAHHAPNRKEYMVVFLVLFVLTVLEVAVAQIPGLSKVLLGIALVGLAVSKASIVGLYYMHLKHETKVMRLTVAIPMATPAVYALVLIAEGAWRLTR